MRAMLLSLLLSALLASVVWTQGSSSCDIHLQPVNNIQLLSAPGWEWAVIATGLQSPRSILFDGSGKMLVLQKNWGILAIWVQDQGGSCMIERMRITVLQDSTLNHGLALSPDGKKLFASSSATAYSWDYDSRSSTVKNKTIIVKNMDNPDHNTRTLYLSQFMRNMLIVSRGSNANIDPGAAYLNGGRGQIRAFDLNHVPSGGYDFSTQGLRLGWGLRNSVGVAEHPVTGGIYSVENSCDDLTRDGVDVHQTNPGEEMNFHGTLINNRYQGQGSNYGYPNCFSAWDVPVLPNNAKLSTGSPFTNSSSLDYLCEGTTPARLTFDAHNAPLDLKFNNSGTEAWVTFHGSWDRTNPSGYKIALIHFDPSTGTPLPLANSNTTSSMMTDVLYSKDLSACPGTHCIRPVGMAFDKVGRLFVASDDTNEIYVIVKTS